MKKLLLLGIISIGLSLKASYTVDLKRARACMAVRKSSSSSILSPVSTIFPERLNAVAIKALEAALFTEVYPVEIAAGTQSPQK